MQNTKAPSRHLRTHTDDPDRRTTLVFLPRPSPIPSCTRRRYHDTVHGLVRGCRTSPCFRAEKHRALSFLPFYLPPSPSPPPLFFSSSSSSSFCPTKIVSSPQKIYTIPEPFAGPVFHTATPSSSACVLNWCKCQAGPPWKFCDFVCYLHYSFKSQK